MVGVQVNLADETRGASCWLRDWTVSISTTLLDGCLWKNSRLWGCWGCSILPSAKMMIKAMFQSFKCPFRDTLDPPHSFFQHSCLWDKRKTFSFFFLEWTFHFKSTDAPWSNSSQDKVVFYWGWQHKIIIKSICILTFPPLGCPQFGNSLARQRNTIKFRFKVLYQSPSPLPRRPQAVQPLCQEIPVAKRTFLSIKNIHLLVLAGGVSYEGKGCTGCSSDVFLLILEDSVIALNVME